MTSPMTSSSASILVVDDDSDMRDIMVEALTTKDWHVQSAANASEAVRLAQQNTFDSIVTDLRMPGTDGLELCRRLLEIDPQVPVILVTAFGDTSAAVGGLRAGAYDFLTKPFEMQALKQSLSRAIKLRALSSELELLRKRRDETSSGELLGRSAAMSELRGLISQVGASDVSVLIVGETGTGKELVAHSIHNKSSRRSKPFIALNCAAIPPNLLESTLFGHVKGAYTGAHADAKGLFEEASGGTLFLDEVGELPRELQPKVLRALQERTVRPVGAVREIPFDVRIVSATNVDLEQAVEAGAFRADLLYRINVVEIDVPPLRQRGNDILFLAQHFVERFAKQSSVSGLTPEAALKLLSYSWPGNVRELENCIQRALALTRHSRLVVDDLPPSVRLQRNTKLPALATPAGPLLPMAEVERRYILHILEQVGGSRNRAAAILGFDRKTLYRKLRAYDVEG
ncbi:MAG: two-component system response regulator AtoC [Polyangiales bacterium]|jgi:two-component system response regulator AtoC